MTRKMKSATTRRAMASPQITSTIESIDKLPAKETGKKWIYASAHLATSSTIDFIEILDLMH